MSKSNAAVTVYACGGCGTNIVNSGLEGYQATYDLFEVDADKKMAVHYLDSSKSNQIDREGFDSLHLFGANLGVDGAGGMRSSLSEIIKREIKSVLTQMVPSDMNIVVFGTGGGSGSVIGPILIHELKAMGKNVIAMCITGIGATNTLKNTVDTYTGLDILSRKVSPLTCMIFNNEQSAGSWPRINSEVNRAITQVWTLNSGVIDGIDKADITSFLNFHKRFGKRPGLAQLRIFDGQLERKTKESALGLIRLFPKGTDITDTVNIHSDFALDGFVTKRLRLSTNVYYLLDYVDSEYVENLLGQYEEAKKASTFASNQRGFAPDDIDLGDDFLVY